MCTKYDIAPEDFANDWIGHTMTQKKTVELTPDTLDVMVRKLYINKKDVPSSSKTIERYPFENHVLTTCC